MIIFGHTLRWAREAPERGTLGTQDQVTQDFAQDTQERWGIPEIYTLPDQQACMLRLHNLRRPLRENGAHFLLLISFPQNFFYFVAFP